jgi:hypothetical protein
MFKSVTGIVIFFSFHVSALLLFDKLKGLSYEIDFENVDEN